MYPNVMPFLRMQIRNGDILLRDDNVVRVSSFFWWALFAIAVSLGRILPSLHA